MNEEEAPQGLKPGSVGAPVGPKAEALGSLDAKGEPVGASVAEKGDSEDNSRAR